jgi:D-alanine-D-alanine ligase
MGKKGFKLMAKTVAVLMGGWSSEREVSLSSGKASAKALREKGYNVVEIDVKRDLNSLLKNLEPKPDVAFNALHGRGGEDGCIQGVLEILGIPYTHSAPLASALAMNKQKAKEILKPMGIPCPDGQLVHIDDLKKGVVPFKPPYVVKPNNEGSSVGVYIIRQGDNKPSAGLDTWSYGPYALVEKYIPGKELSVAVMGARGEKAKALTVTEIVANSDFYNYEAKYAVGGSTHILPAPIHKDVFNEALRIAALAHEKLGCTGVTRSDFRYNDNEPGTSGLFYLETNTQPGMTPTSLVPEQAAHVGMSFGDLVAWLVENAAIHA